MSQWLSHAPAPPSSAQDSPLCEIHGGICGMPPSVHCTQNCAAARQSAPPPPRTRAARQGAQAAARGAHSTPPAMHPWHARARCQPQPANTVWLSRNVNRPAKNTALCCSGPNCTHNCAAARGAPQSAVAHQRGQPHAHHNTQTSLSDVTPTWHGAQHVGQPPGSQAASRSRCQRHDQPCSLDGERTRLR